MPSRRIGPTLQVAIALIYRHGRYLITQRHLDDDLGGYWEFPGGKRKPGESWQRCLRREMQEELGVSPEKVQPFTTMRGRWKENRIFFKIFRCTLVYGDRPSPKAAQALRWVDPQGLLAYRFPPANQKLISQLIAESRALRGIATIATRDIVHLPVVGYNTVVYRRLPLRRGRS